MTSRPFRTIRAFHNSAVFWGWLATSANFGCTGGMLLLMLRFLLPEEIGIWYVFTSIAGFAYLANLGFGPTILRHTGYLWAGADQIQVSGVAGRVLAGKPNWPQLSRLYASAKLIYLLLGALAGLLLLAVGTPWIYANAVQMDKLSPVYLAWGIYALSVISTIISGLYMVFVEGIGLVADSQRYQFVTRVTNLAVVAVLLPLGFGLLAISLAMVMSSLLATALYYRRFRRAFAPVYQHATDYSTVRTTFAVVWPNTWRLGVMTLGGYLVINAGTLVCNRYLGLAMTGQYGLTLQVVRLCSSFAAVWTSVAVPRLNHFRTIHAIDRLRRLFVQRLLLATITYWALGLLALFLGPHVLSFFRASVQLLPPYPMAFMLVYLFLEFNHSCFASLILTENRVPFAPSAVISGVSITALSVILVSLTPLGIWAMLVAQAVVQAAYNNWYWVYRGIQTLDEGFEAFLSSVAREFMMLVRHPLSVAASGEEPVLVGGDVHVS